jgi:heptosyltransferase-1
MKKITMYKKILIIKPSSLGDVIHSFPFLNSLKSCFPRAEIHWLIARGLEGLVAGHPMIDTYITINKDTWKKITEAGRTITEVKQLFKRLRGERYDLVIDLQGLLRSGILTMATRAPVRVGFREAREGSRLFYNRKIPGGRNVHAVDRYLRIAEALGCEKAQPGFPFPLVGDTSDRIEQLTGGIAGYAVMVPGARWKTKIWPAEYFGLLAAKLPLKTFVVGGADDISIAEAVVRASEGRAVSLAGKTSLQELIKIIRRARFVCSNDSGPMHIAAARGIPVIAVFGPTSPVRTGPYGTGHIIITSDVPCSPCFKKKCRDLRCMEGITVEDVYQKAREIIEGGSPAR